MGMITFKSIKGVHIVTVNGEQSVFNSIGEALKYIAARY